MWAQWVHQVWKDVGGSSSESCMIHWGAISVDGIWGGFPGLVEVAVGDVWVLGVKEVHTFFLCCWSWVAQMCSCCCSSCCHLFSFILHKAHSSCSCFHSSTTFFHGTWWPQSRSNWARFRWGTFTIWESCEKPSNFSLGEGVWVTYPVIFSDTQSHC